MSVSCAPLSTGDNMELEYVTTDLYRQYIESLVCMKTVEHSWDHTRFPGGKMDPHPPGSKELRDKYRAEICYCGKIVRWQLVRACRECHRPYLNFLCFGLPWEIYEGICFPCVRTMSLYEWAGNLKIPDPKYYVMPDGWNPNQASIDALARLRALR